MGKTAASHVWGKPIKYIGNGFIDLICRCSDPGAGGLMIGQGMELAAVDGEFVIYSTAQPDFIHMTVAEEVANTDRYFLGRKKGAKILHNQKLAGAYKIGDAVYQNATGTWTYAQQGTAASLLGEVGIVCGPADRITATVLKNIDDALTATEPVDICI